MERNANDNPNPTQGDKMTKRTLSQRHADEYKDGLAVAAIQRDHYRRTRNVIGRRDEATEAFQNMKALAGHDPERSFWRGMYHGLS